MRRVDDLRLACVGRHALGVAQSPGADLGPQHTAGVDLQTVPQRLRVGPNVAVNWPRAGVERWVRRRTPVARLAFGLDEATGLQLVILPVLGQRGQGLLGGRGGGEALSLQVQARLCDGRIFTRPRVGDGRLGTLKGRL